MSILSALVGLETLPGFPEAYSPGLMDILILTVGIPTALAAVIFVMGMGPHWFRQSRGHKGELETHS